jgi:hypothetical protein
MHLPTGQIGRSNGILSNDAGAALPVYQPYIFGPIIGVRSPFALQ